MLGTSVNGKHTYLGPGGSLRDTGGMNLANQNGAGGMAIQPRPDALKKTHEKGLSGVAGSVLSNSVQENFRGFTYTGESVLVGMISDCIVWHTICLTSHWDR